MSFSSEQKQHMITEQHKSACCRKALLCGILASKAVCDGDDIITLSLEKDEFCEFTSRLIGEFYGRSPTATKPKNGGRCRNLSFQSRPAFKYLKSISDTKSLFINKCPACTASFLKGVFLSCGKISDPQKQYFLELSPAHNVEHIYNLLSENGLMPRKTSRNGKESIYFRRASEIEDFCGFVGLTGAMFAIANTQIEREFLNNTNRVVNCETNNIEKSVSASGKHVAVIRELIAHNLLSSLPDELEYTARLRIQNESLSLSQLSKLFTPPISKSGLSHRLNKILETAELLLADKK